MISGLFLILSSKIPSLLFQVILKHIDSHLILVFCGKIVESDISVLGSFLDDAGTQELAAKGRMNTSVRCVM